VDEEKKGEDDRLCL